MNSPALYPSFTVILVDDESAFLSAALFALRRNGITNVEIMDDSRMVSDRLARGDCGVLVLDINMPFVNGKELLSLVTRDFPDVYVVMITATNEVGTAVDCMKSGARDYVLKPLKNDQLTSAIRRVIESRILHSETVALKERVLDDSIRNPQAFSHIITCNKLMFNTFKYVEAIGPSDVPVLITGETGTGKELMAQAIHEISGRTGKFVAVNAAGIDDTVLSDTLFGHVRGAFTGAERERKGLVAEAAGGTLFLDEIGDLKPESQVKVLRLLQEGMYHPIGSDSPLSSSARIVVATNRDLKAAMKDGRFRNDLFYRLQAHEVRLPPLRERPEDISLLTNAIIDEACMKFQRARPYINSELYTLLSTFVWPGNIRELRGILFDAVSRNTTDTLGLDYLKAKLRELRNESQDKTDGLSVQSERILNKSVTFSSSLPTIDELEIMLIREAIHRTKGNKTLAADLIGMARTTLIKRLKTGESS